MDHDNSLGRLSPPQRNHFFFGKMMGVAQFEREQRYGMKHRWLLNRLTLGTGILCGLDVTLTDDGKRFRIAPGVAVDGCGREIVVSRPVEYDPFKSGGDCGCGEGPGITTEGEYVLCLSYRECTADDQPVEYSAECLDQPDCLPDTTIESFAIGVQEAKTLKGFVCKDWTAADPDDPKKPPSIELLRDRLVQQFGAGCAPAADSAVPIKRIAATKLGDKVFALTIPNQPHARIHSQAELLEMVLCLAQCCGSPQVEPPPPSDTLRVADVNIMQWLAEDPKRLVKLDPDEGSNPPRFTPENSETLELFARITFTHPLDGSSLPSPSTRDPPPPSIVVDYDDLKRTSAQLDRPIVVSMEESNIIQIEGIVDPGRYTLTLFGSELAPDPKTENRGHRPIRSCVPPPATGRVLDGEPQSSFPSGDAKDGGDFTYVFDIGEMPQTITLTLVKVTINEDEYDNLASLSWERRDTLTVSLEFSKELDDTTLHNGIRVSAKQIEIGTPTITQVRARVVLVSIPVQLPVTDPSEPAIILTLSGTELLAADSQQFDADPNTADAMQLPTGDEAPGGPDFSFSIAITIPG